MPKTPSDPTSIQIVVPSQLELEHLQSLDRRFEDAVGVGVGLVEVACGVAAMLDQKRIDEVWLCGIAGTFDAERFPIGSALEFGSARLHGIGVGEAEHHQTPRQLGWTDDDDQEIWGSDPALPAVLTVAAASGCLAEAERRRRDHREVIAEDMETFAVAQVCRRLGCRLRVFRGCSNRVGDRDPRRWNVREACRAVAQRVRLCDTEQQH